MHGQLVPELCGIVLVGLLACSSECAFAVIVSIVFRVFWRIVLSRVQYY